MEVGKQVTMTDFIAWHGKTLNEHQALRDQWAKKGYRFLSLSIYGLVAAPVYAVVMIKRQIVAVQRDWPCLTAAQLQQAFDEQAVQGFGPVILAATGSASDPRFPTAEPNSAHAVWADVGGFDRSSNHPGHEQSREEPGPHSSVGRGLRECERSAFRRDLDAQHRQRIVE
jgi:hypothetical protein